jgi:hypothetical protein
LAFFWIREHSRPQPFQLEEFPRPAGQTQTHLHARQVVGNVQHRRPPAPQLLEQQVMDECHGGRVDAGGDLVQQHQGSPAQQHARHAHQLLLAGGQLQPRVAADLRGAREGGRTARGVP